MLRPQTKLRPQTRLRLPARRRTGYRHPKADQVFIATLVIGFFAIALLLVMLYPSPIHLLGLI
jgi:hypothetical protein